ncbi:MAG: formate/nitrite transporter family protein [Clostridiales Family XIII bacterium]|jgi:formate/nitrite transporter|nr:formate/nitrite transporter family protein [Clostridiales Family XIII bacterium]
MNFFSAAEVTANCVPMGEEKVKYPAYKTLFLGVLAGMLIALAAATSNTAVHDIANIGLARMTAGLLFPFGLAMVIVAGAELFTGSCLIAVSVLARRITLLRMLKNWLLVYFGNFVGSFLVAAACAWSGQLHYSGNALAAYTIKTAAAKCSLGFGNAIVLGIFCNLLVCLGVFMALSAKDQAGRVLGAYLPTAFFVICGFEHCIANMYYIPAGIFAAGIPQYAAKALELGVHTESLTWGNFFLANLLPVTLGNIVGGVALGAVMWICRMRGDPSTKRRNHAE